MSHAKYINKLLSIVFLFIGLTIVIVVSWQIFGNWYLNKLQEPIGGDYYTGLTYSTYFARNPQLPPSGWIPFWNSGVPVMGSYQWLVFYPIALIGQLTDAARAMDIVLVVTIVLFFAFSHLLFFEISKNHFIALAFTLLLISSQASYYQLTVGGFITGASMQWYLPASLFFILRFLENHARVRSFLLGILLSAIAVIHHQGMGSIFVAIPVLGVFFVKLILGTTSQVKKFKYIFVALLLVVLLSSVVLGPSIIFASFSEVASACDNPQCWGIYPLHIQKWIGWTTPIITVIFVILAFLIATVGRTFWGRHISLRPLTAIGSGTLLVLLYPVLAYLHLINTFANSIFPRRMFWALLIMLLALSAEAFMHIRRFNKYISYVISGATLIVVLSICGIYVKGDSFAFEILTDRTNAVPNYIHKSIIKKFTTQTISETLEESLPIDDRYRIHSTNPAFVQWWNIPSQIASPLGYTSAFNTKNFAWTYYLQTSLQKDTKNLPDEIFINRASFLFDAFGIGATAYTDYDPRILQAQTLFSKKGKIFSTLNTEKISPIITSTNVPAILFIGSAENYDTFTRMLALINFNSQRAIIVYGGKNVPSLNAEDVKIFPIIVIYELSGKLEELEPYVSSGGKLFIELATTKSLPKDLSPFLPNVKLEPVESTVWNGILNTSSDITKELSLTKFGPLNYQGNPWKLIQFINADDNTAVLLTQNSHPILIQKKYQKGELFISGMNLPYHALEHVSSDELKILNRLLSKIVVTQKISVVAQVARPNGENITITANGTTGVLFKENYNTGWHAQVNGNSAKIYPASLNFMYIPVTIQGTSKIQLDYVGSVSNWIFFILTLLTFAVVIVAIISPHTTIYIVATIANPVLKILNHHHTVLKKDEDSNY